MKTDAARGTSALALDRRNALPKMCKRAWRSPGAVHPCHCAQLHLTARAKSRNHLKNRPDGGLDKVFPFMRVHRDKLNADLEHGRRCHIDYGSLTKARRCAKIQADCSGEASCPTRQSARRGCGPKGPLGERPFSKASSMGARCRQREPVAKPSPWQGVMTAIKFWSSLASVSGTVLQPQTWQAVECKEVGMGPVALSI